MGVRIAVFIDSQNTYMRARECFFEEYDSHTCGQFHPLLLGRRLCHHATEDRELCQARIYCGMPSNEKDRKGYGARRRQIARWNVDAPTVHVVARPLRYPRNYPAEPAQEKGVDVELAVDFVTMAIRGEYDVGILMSEDTDLRPALEAVLRLDGGPRVEVASWRPRWTSPRNLTLPARTIFTHFLSRDDYESVRDAKDYGAPLPRLNLPR